MIKMKKKLKRKIKKIKMKRNKIQIFYKYNKLNKSFYYVLDDKVIN